MCHWFTAIQTSLIGLLILSTSTASAQTSPCAPVEAETVTQWASVLGADPVQFLLQNLQPLHKEIQPSSNSSSRTRQMKVLGKHFDIQTWATKIDDIQSPAKTLSSSEQLLMQYLFTAWIRERYMGLLNRTVRKDELTEVEKRPFRLARVVRKRVQSYPVEPRVVAIESYDCTSDLDKTTYDCSSPLVTLEVQASPYLLCGDEVASSRHRFRYLIRKSDHGLKIVDVIRGQFHVYQDAYKDYLSYRNDLSADQLKAYLQRITFTNAATFTGGPQNDYGLFTKLLDETVPAKTDEVERIPASQNSPKNVDPSQL